MKLLICGSRNILMSQEIESYYFNKFDTIISNIEITEIISGCAEGADKLGERYSKVRNLKLLRFPANWEKHGKKAGFIRNKEMVKIANFVIAVWDHKSKGTEHTINLARKAGLPLRVIGLYEHKRKNEGLE